MLGLIIPLYSGPNTAPVDWQDIMNADTRVPVAVIINPNNGPGKHVYTDYLKPIRQINSVGGDTLGYIPTRNGHTPISEIRADMVKYFRKYHVNGVFLDEMTTDPTRKNIRYYRRIARMVWHMHNGAHIFANPGTYFPRNFLRTGIQTFVEMESGYHTVLHNSPSEWTKNIRSQTFSEISYATPQAALNTVEKAMQRGNLKWVYITNGSDGNPYTNLPVYWNSETWWVAHVNAEDR